MRKWILGCLATIAIFVSAAAIIVVSANLTDAPLEPEVQKVLAVQFVANASQQKAYEFYLGAFAGNLEQAEEMGAVFLQDLIQGGKKWQNAAKTRWWSVEPLPCKICRADDLESKPIADLFSKFSEQVKGYIKLVEFRDIKSFKGNPSSVMGGPAALPLALHPYFHLQLSVWLDKKGDERVFDLLQSSNQFLHNLMQNGTLLERMMATIAMVDNAKFLAQERERHPKMPIPRDLVESFRMPEAEDILFGAMEEEVRAFARATEIVRTYSDIQQSDTLRGPLDPSGFLIGWIPVRLAFQRNDTINRFYRIAMQVANTDCPAGVDFMDCIPDLHWTKFNSPFDYLINPIGRSLIQVFAPHENRKFKLIEKRQELSALRESFHL